MISSRYLSSDTEVYRAVVVYYNNKTKDEETFYFGPYNTPGKAKALRTRFKKNYYRIKNNELEFIRDYEERAVQWEELQP